MQLYDRHRGARVLYSHIFGRAAAASGGPQPAAAAAAASGAAAGQGAAAGAGAGAGARATASAGAAGPGTVPGGATGTVSFQPAPWQHRGGPQHPQHPQQPQQPQQYHSRGGAAPLGPLPPPARRVHYTMRPLLPLMRQMIGEYTLVSGTGRQPAGAQLRCCFDTKDASLYVCGTCS